MKTFFHVNIYMVNQAKGGPEEGGWWYDMGEFIRTIFVSSNREDAARKMRRATRLLNATLNKGKPEYHSVLSEGQYQAIIDEHSGEDFPQERPYYE